MAHSSTLINGSIDADHGNQAAARSFLGFVEDSESLETDFLVVWGSADQVYSWCPFSRRRKKKE